MDSLDIGAKKEGINKSGDNNSAGLTELELGNDDVIGLKFK